MIDKLLFLVYNKNCDIEKRNGKKDKDISNNNVITNVNNMHLKAIYSIITA